MITGSATEINLINTSCSANGTCFRGPDPVPLPAGTEGFCWSRWGGKVLLRLDVACKQTLARLFSFFTQPGSGGTPDCTIIYL